eukprot:2468197-Rhodomonas_salina.3
MGREADRTAETEEKRVAERGEESEGGSARRSERRKKVRKKRGKRGKNEGKRREGGLQASGCLLQAALIRQPGSSIAYVRPSLVAA